MTAQFPEPVLFQDAVFGAGLPGSVNEASRADSYLPESHQITLAAGYTCREERTGVTRPQGQSIAIEIVVMMPVPGVLEFADALASAVARWLSYLHGGHLFGNWDQCHEGFQFFRFRMTTVPTAERYSVSARRS